MAYRIVEGVPGSGKSYYIVDWLALKSGFCLQLKDGGYVLDPAKKVRVITNIAGLKISHEDFQSALDDAGGFEVFFTKEYQRDFSGDFHIIYILDEAQEWFHPQLGEKWTSENLAYFTWARHQGHDIFLLTQNTSLLRRDVVFLAEFIVEAQPRIKNVSKELTYKHRTVAGDQIKLERLLFSKHVASLYESMEKGEVIKIRNPHIRKVLAAAALAAVLMYFGFSSLLKRWDSFYGGSPAPAAAASSASALPTASAPPASSAVSASVPSSASVSASTTSPSSSTSNSAQQVEYYMYRLDHAVFKDGVRFLLGITWIPMREFPYQLVQKGNSYFTLIPAVLLPALENNSRALPVRTKN